MNTFAAERICHGLIQFSNVQWGKITNFSGKRKRCLNIKMSQIQVVSKYIQRHWLPWNDNIQSAVNLTCRYKCCWHFEMFFLLFAKSAERETLSSNVTLWQLSWRGADETSNIKRSNSKKNILTQFYSWLRIYQETLILPHCFQIPYQLSEGDQYIPIKPVLIFWWLPQAFNWTWNI